MTSLIACSVSGVLDWTAVDVGCWLDTIGLSDYKQQFVSHDIQGPELLTLGRTDLQVRETKRRLILTTQFLQSRGTNLLYCVHLQNLFTYCFSGAWDYQIGSCQTNTAWCQGHQVKIEPIRKEHIIDVNKIVAIKCVLLGHF